MSNDLIEGQMVYSIRKWFNVMSNDLMETEVEVRRNNSAAGNKMVSRDIKLVAPKTTKNTRVK